MATQRGIFLDVVGLWYECEGIRGTTGQDFTFDYTPGSPVTFSIGPLVLGKAHGGPILTVTDLVGKGTSIMNAHLLNRARLLYSLSDAIGFEKPIVIDPKIKDIIARYASEICLDCDDPSGLDGILSKIGDALEITPKTIPHVRNHLRREAAGFKVMRDLRIPTRDGNFVYGDVYLPLDTRKTYPVLISCTTYGKRIVYSGPDFDNSEEIAAFERAEDDWHSTTADVEIHVPNTGPWFGGWTRQRGYETIGTFNTFTFVPQGYAMVKIDPRGVSQTPGRRGLPGQQALDYYAAVEWAAEQGWSNGNVALTGNSYGANSQWAVAKMKPKGLKCFIPYATDLDPYREVAYTGGIPTFKYLSQWYAGVQSASPKWKDALDVVNLMRERPFYDEFWDQLRVFPEQIDLPCFIAASQLLILHGRGAFEAWRSRVNINASTHLQLVDCDYYHWPNHEAAGKLLSFLDHHLKGLPMDNLEAVGIQTRLGNGEWYWRTETNWPVPGTKYTNWHLTRDAKLSTEQETGSDTIFWYSAEVPPANPKAGAVFESEPFPAEVEFAGYFMATLTISSTAPDADVVVSLWALDTKNKIVPFGARGKLEPVAKGFLRASHRQQDFVKSLPERPWHTHTQEDNRVLQNGQLVTINVEIYPAAARIQKGWKLRLDITPSEEQPGIPGYHPLDFRNWLGESSKGTRNAIHVGSNHLNFITCPVVPTGSSHGRTSL